MPYYYPCSNLNFNINLLQNNIDVGNQFKYTNTSNNLNSYVPSNNNTYTFSGIESLNVSPNDLISLKYSGGYSSTSQFNQNIANGSNTIPYPPGYSRSISFLYQENLFDWVLNSSKTSTSSSINITNFNFTITN